MKIKITTLSRLLENMEETNKDAVRHMEESYQNNTLKWRMKSEHEILIQDMTDDHVNNTLRVLHTFYPDSVNEKWISIFTRESKKRN